MFLVANTSGKVLVISDLGVSISSKQALDLDTMRLDLPSPDVSKDLQTCIKRGLVKVIKSDRTKKRKKQPVALPSLTDKGMLKEIQQTLREEIRQQLSVQKPQTGDAQMSQILDVLRQILAKGSPVPKEIIREIIVEQNNLQDEPANVDEDTLNEIHARAVDRLSKETDREIDYKVQRVESNISQQVLELEELIG